MRGEQLLLRSATDKRMPETKKITIKKLLDPKNMKTKRLIQMATFAALTAGFASCGNKSNTEADNEEILPDYMCLFQGTLPCADCPGIETKVTFNPDSTVAITRMYLDSDGTSETEYGTWTYQDSLFTVETRSNDSVPTKETVYFKILPESEIALVGEDKVVKSPYILLKKQPMVAKSFEGTYTLGGEEKGSYQQTLTIKDAGNSLLNVNITQTGGKGDGCEFSGQGKIVNNQIEINLKDINPDLNATMVIRPLDDESGVNVFTSRFDDRYDLMNFCGGGGSLAGDYIKATSKKTGK